MQDILELAVSATASGCVYGLIALAYLLMIRPTGIINFAVGEWAMVAAFGGFLLLTKYEWPYPLGMAAVLAFMLLVGWVSERIAVRPLVEKGMKYSFPDGKRAGFDPDGMVVRVYEKDRQGRVLYVGQK